MDKIKGSFRILFKRKVLKLIKLQAKLKLMIKNNFKRETMFFTINLKIKSGKPIKTTMNTYLIKNFKKSKDEANKQKNEKFK